MTDRGKTSRATMDDDGEWVLVEQAGERERWSPTSKDASSPIPKPLKIVFAEPAKHWTDALPIGNGRLGAMVWGGVQSELIQLNHDTLWTGTPGNYTNPHAPEALAEVRKLVDAGQYSEATAEAVKLSGDPSDVYQPLGDIKLRFDDFHSAYESYQRELDLDTSTVKITYRAGGTVFTREHFASHPDQVIVTRLAGSKPGSLSCTLHLDSKLTFQSSVKSSTLIVMEGSCPAKRVPPKANGEDVDPNPPKGVQFSAVLGLQISESGGSAQVLGGDKLKIIGSDWVVLVLMASSSFDGPFTQPSDSAKHPISECLRTMEVVKNMSYFDLYARHLDDYQKLFRRVSLHLSPSSVAKMEQNEVPTWERVKSFQSDEDPSLVELLFQYGRYLLISCSRPGSQPSNLQGIWNKDIEPPWDCSPHLNINLQMNYWPCLPCNLRECQEPLFDYITSLSINGQKTAKVNYEARGWVVHQVSDIWAKTSPDRGEAVWALWPMGGAWLCTHLWEHYQYTSDKGFLERRAFPLMEGCAEFLLDWLIEGPGGFLETNPSTSPEHMFTTPNGKAASVSYSSTMDISIIKEVFSAVISAAEVLKSKSSTVQKVLAAIAKLPPTKIARDGSIMEWALDFEDPDLHHRHLSHLFGLFPGHTITLEETPDLCKAAGYSLYKRGEEGPGWSTTWKAALYARLRNSENSYRMIKHLFILVDPDRESDFEGGLYANLFAAHPPFQIDANFGFAAAIAEMVVQSTKTDMYLLPALPRDKWPDGCVKGLKARGGITVNICWTAGGLHQVGLWSIDRDCIRTLHYGGKASVSKLLAGRVHTFDNRLKCVKTTS